MPTSVRAIAPSYGDFTSIRVERYEIHELGPEDVLIAVKAAGVNPVDYKLAAGLLGRNAEQLPLQLGFEVAGVVEAVGVDAVGSAGRIEVGQEVVAFEITGGFADRVVVPAADVFPKPAALNFPEAANLLLIGTTATHLLEAAEVTADSVVLVHAASGGVGMLAVQLARLRGAKVVGTASSANHEQVRKLGAEPVAYGPGLYDRVRALAPEGITAALDCAGTAESREVSIALLDNPRHYATVVDTAFQEAIDVGGRALGGMLPESEPGNEIRDAARADLVRLAGDGLLEVKVVHTYPLAEVGAALALLSQGHPGGNLAIVP